MEQAPGRSGSHVVSETQDMVIIHFVTFIWENFSQNSDDHLEKSS